MTDRERTTKRVEGVFTLTFHGDYISAEDVETYFQGWVDAGLDDRDDLRSWSFKVSSVREETGDPEGFDT